VKTSEYLSYSCLSMESMYPSATRTVLGIGVRRRGRK
jgi:hypothetical protein